MQRKTIGQSMQAFLERMLNTPWKLEEATAQYQLIIPIALEEAYWLNFLVSEGIGEINQSPLNRFQFSWLDDYESIDYLIIRDPCLHRDKQRQTLAQLIRWHFNQLVEKLELGWESARYMDRTYYQNGCLSPALSKILREIAVQSNQQPVIRYVGSYQGVFTKDESAFQVFKETIIAELTIAPLTAVKPLKELAARYVMAHKHRFFTQLPSLPQDIIDRYPKLDGNYRNILYKQLGKLRLCDSDRIFVAYDNHAPLEQLFALHEHLKLSNTKSNDDTLYDAIKRTIDLVKQDFGNYSPLFKQTYRYLKKILAEYESNKITYQALSFVS